MTICEPICFLERRKLTIKSSPVRIGGLHTIARIFGLFARVYPFCSRAFPFARFFNERT